MTQFTKWIIIIFYLSNVKKKSILDSFKARIINFFYLFMVYHQMSMMSNYFYL